MSLTAAEEMELIALLEVEEKYSARNDYYEYVKYTHGAMYKYTRHGEYICRQLDNAVKELKRMYAGEIPMTEQYIMLSVPPQHGKSMHITETFPSYFLGNFPELGVIEVSYNERFAEKFGGKNKDKIKLYGDDLFNIRISGDTNAKGEWEIVDGNGRKTRGGMISRGILSGITGSSLGDCIIIDDPIKNREEANSQVIRDKQWDEWENSISSRIHPGAIVVVIMTRWHEDDLCGRLLNKDYGPVLPWKRINLPLECDEMHIIEEGNPLNRKIGEALWPERYGSSFIDVRKVYKDSFTSLYQGRPRIEDGNFFNRNHFRYFREETIYNQTYFIVGEKKYEKLKCWAFQTVDTANSEKTINDFFVVSTWYVTPENDLLWYDAYRTHVTGPDQKPLLKELNYRYRPRFQAIEDKTFGTNLIQECKREGMTIRPIKVDKDKVTRSLVIAARYEVGKVYHRENMPNLTDVEDELLSFPRGKHDDTVDTASMAGEVVHEIAGSGDPWTAMPDSSTRRRSDDDDDDGPKESTFW